MFNHFWRFLASKTDIRPSYELIQMSTGGEAALAEPDKNRSLVDHDDRSSLSSDEDAQAGVKNIEVISQIWTKWSLISAYIG